MATLQTQQLERPSVHASQPRFCDPHRQRARVSVPATHFVEGMGLCDRCFRGDAISPREHGRRYKQEPGLGSPLTARERQVVYLLTGGRPSKEIAASMHVSERTVKFHLSRLFAKSGTKARAELVAWYLKAQAPVTTLDLPSLQLSIERAKHDLLRACVTIRETADDAHRKIEEASRVGERLARIAAALAIAGQACGLDQRLQNPGRPAPHFGGDETPEGDGDLEGQTAATGRA